MVRGVHDVVDGPVEHFEEIDLFREKDHGACASPWKSG
jgi:hypothetical protein